LPISAKGLCPIYLRGSPKLSPKGASAAMIFP
jgi:hypothetical protein